MKEINSIYELPPREREYFEGTLYARGGASPKIYTCEYVMEFDDLKEPLPEVLWMMFKASVKEERYRDTEALKQEFIRRGFRMWTEGNFIKVEGPF